MKMNSVFWVVLVAFASFTTGCTEQQRKATAVGMTGAGGILLAIDHPAAKVVGAVLAGSGTILMVICEINGVEVREEIKLSSDQVKAFKDGKNIILEDKMGVKRAIEWKRAEEGIRVLPAGDAII